MEFPDNTGTCTSSGICSVYRYQHYMVVPEIRVSPQTVHNKENTSPIMLKCNTRLTLPSESLLTWTKNSSFLGSFLNSPTNVIHRGQIGNIRWMDDNLIFSIENPSSRDSGIYQCCVVTRTHYRQCKDVSVNIWSAADNACTNTRFMPSTPLQINQFQSKSLLRDGEVMTMLWTFNMSHWKISTRFPQCQSHLINMEMGIEQWFGRRTTQTRSKREVLEGILGGIGTVGSLTNAMNTQTLKSDLDNIGFIGGKGVKIQKSLNQLLEKMVMNTAAVLGSSVSHLQDATLALVESTHETQVAKACLEIQIEYSTNLKMIAQALQSGITPLGILRNLPVEYDFALNHTDLWVNKWLGCERNICVGTSLIPVIRREGTIVPVTVLGIPVSKTQQVFYQLQYTDFAFDGVNTEQLDISSCLHFVSKVMCLPGQDKVIYHSCFHNRSSCHARIETVQTLHDLVTPVSPNKICFQVMSETEMVSAFYSTCVHKENLPMGLYCIEGNVRSLSKKEGNFNITSIGKRNLTAFPIQFNLSQINDFPWDMWTSEIKKDKGLLDLLTKQLKDAEIIFRHEQGELNDIEHEWNGMSGRTWKSFGKSVHCWSQSSFQTAVGNVLFNPIIIIFLLVLMCIFYQVFVMCTIQKIYKNIKIEMKQEDNILRGMLNRKMTF
ncbi:uncharacterized protein ACNLHF_004843 [Anomaloglossus baeobatrachus]|uniref:uncharacterized protein LOC142265841 n=1 Tax=Anomaloglossus baeobatrachus TaxID=238106 RepID=UPI003F4F64DD